MFEIRETVSDFAAAVRRIPGLELIDEEDLPQDEDDAKPVAYLLVPDLRALAEIESLWTRWQRGDELGAGFAPWRNVFSLLRNLRPWGPQDRVDPLDAKFLREELRLAEPGSLIRLEIELVFRHNEARGIEASNAVGVEVARSGGVVISSSRIDAVAYHALLVDLPSHAIEDVINFSPNGIASTDAVMHIRPQSVATQIGIEDIDGSQPLAPATAELGDPILALIDGVPVAGHRLLQSHLVVSDIVGLEPLAQVEGRIHGTAMASLIVHGDRNSSEVPLPRKIHVIPVVSRVSGDEETFPNDSLIVDVIYRAILSMREGADALAPAVIIVNISLGNRRKKFHGQVSAWARLLDYLSYKYGILFVVSGGNELDAFESDAFGSRIAFEDSSAAERAAAVIKGIGALKGERKIISPAESVNAVTVGASNQDAVPDTLRRVASALVDPYLELLISNPSSSLGPGYGGSVKPDILLPGSRERLSVVRSDGSSISLQPGRAGRACGLKVAAPPIQGQEGAEAYTSGTSGAAALASRTCHQIHDALEQAYGRGFTDLPARHRVALLKALLCHTARWPSATAQLIMECLGPEDLRQHVRRKDNVRRLIGYGIVDPESAVACADDRATFWATGEISANQVITVPIPIPVAMGQQSIPHEVCATVGWITPTLPGLKAYRSVRLKLLEPTEVPTLGISACSEQPDSNQVGRGTLLSRRWTGQRAAVVTNDMSLKLKVQREPDLGSTPIDEPIPFGIAVTISMPGVNGIYAEVSQRLNLRARA